MLLQCKLHFDLAFQSTLPRGERRSSQKLNLSALDYFNPRSREGSDVAPFPEGLESPAISIHAPARGATKNINDILKNPEISIHAPARGATKGFALIEPDGKISIHAPARGATQAKSLIYLL